MHCWLARQDDDLLAGGFIGDFVKGEVPTNLPPLLQLGIRLHRHIDAKSGQLQSLRRTYGMFGPRLRRYAPVLQDMVADLVLAQHWDQFGEGELPSFSKHCYECIGRHPLPESALSMYSHMVETDLLSRYTNLETVAGICVRILTRFRVGYSEQCMRQLLADNEDKLLADFQVYYQDLLAVTDAWIASAYSQ